MLKECTQAGLFVGEAIIWLSSWIIQDSTPDSHWPSIEWGQWNLNFTFIIFPYFQAFKTGFEEILP